MINNIVSYCKQYYFYCFSKIILFTCSSLLTILLMLNTVGIAASVRLPRCSAVCKPVYSKSMHMLPIVVPGPVPAGRQHRRERCSHSSRRRIGEDAASAAAVAAAASSFFALKRPPSEIITQQQHHMIHNATHSLIVGGWQLADIIISSIISWQPTQIVIRMQPDLVGQPSASKTRMMPKSYESANASPEEGGRDWPVDITG